MMRRGGARAGARGAGAGLRTRAAAGMMAKELHFNADGSALKKMQAGADKLASVVGVTLGPKGRNVVLEARYGSPRIVNDGVTVAKEVELEDPVENIGARLVRQAGQNTNDLAGDGTTTATILSAAFIAEGMKIIAAGANPVQITRGIDRTVGALVKDLEGLSTEVDSNDDLCNVATVSAGGNELVGQLIRDAMEKVGRKGVITLEESRTAEDNLVVVEGMQFERGFVSPYFVTDPERMVAEFENCKLLLVDKKITSARDLVGILEEAIRGGWPLMIMAEDIEQEPLATLVVNKLRGQLKVVAIKAPGFGDRKSQYLEDIAIMTGATVVKEELGLDVSTVGPEVLGQAAKVTLSKENCVIVGDGSTQGEVEASVQVGAQTETELKEKKLRVEDALNATKAAVEEGIVIGGGCTLLKLAACVDAILPTLDNDEQRVGREIVKKALSYPLKLVASNAGTNGSVVMQKVLESSDTNHGFNAATGEYGDPMQEGIIDPTKVIRCALENSASVARAFLTSDVVVTEIPSEDGAEADAG